MGRKKKSAYEPTSPDYDEQTGINSDFSDMMSEEEKANISDEVEFSGLKDKFKYQLSFSECSRDFTTVVYNKKRMSVKPLLEMKSGKFILLTNEGEKIAVFVEDLKEK